MFYFKIKIIYFVYNTVNYLKKFLSLLFQLYLVIMYSIFEALIINLNAMLDFSVNS